LFRYFSLQFVVSVLFIAVCCFGTFHCSLLFRYVLLQFVVSVLFIAVCCFGTFYCSLLFRYFLFNFICVIWIVVFLIVCFIIFSICEESLGFSVLVSIIHTRDPWPLKMAPTGCTETTIINHHYSQRNNPEERSSHI